MKTDFLTSIRVITLIIILSTYAYSQNETRYDFTVEMNTSVSTIAVDAREFSDVKRFTEIDRHFKSEWVREFKSVEILISKDGKLVKFVTKDDNITDDLRQAISNADSGRTIKVSYEYIPENTIKNSNIHTDGFSFTILPDNDASFPGGEHNMKEYLDEAGVNTIQEIDIDIYNLAAVKFTVTESGNIVDAHIANKSKSAEVDKLLLNAICNMPSWTPASYTDGVTVAQEYILSVGDHSSCTVNLLNIQKYALK